MSDRRLDPKRAFGDSGARWLYAHMLYSQIVGHHVSLAKLGEDLSAVERKWGYERDNDYSASTVSRWQRGEYMPDNRVTTLAMCHLCKGRIDPGWLDYGEASSAEAPPQMNFTLADLAAARASGRRERK